MIIRLTMLILIAWGGFTLTGHAQEEEIFLPGPGGEPGVSIKGKVKCALDDGTTRTVRCPTISASDSQPCPTGPCFSWEHRGCLYYPPPPQSATPKSSYKVQKNDEAEYEYPYNAATGVAGKKVEEKPNTRVICYEAYQCSCTDDSTGSYRCESRRLDDVAVVEYTITNENCGIFESVDDPE